MKYGLLLLLVFCTSVSFAQDTIYLIPAKHNKRQNTSDLPDKEPSFGPRKIPYWNRSGKLEIPVKILKVAGLQVFFLRSNTSAPVYTLRKNQIESITFENGMIETFPEYDSARARASEKKKPFIPNEKNLLTIGMGIYTFSIPFFGTGSRDLTPVFYTFAGYERLIWGGRFGAAVTPFVGFNKGAFGTSFTIKHYAKSSSKVRFGAGPSLMVGSQYYTEPIGSWLTGQVSMYKYWTTLMILSANLNIQTSLKNDNFFNFDANFGKMIANSKEKTHTDKGQLTIRLGYGKRF